MAFLLVEDPHCSLHTVFCLLQLVLHTGFILLMLLILPAGVNDLLLCLVSFSLFSSKASSIYGSKPLVLL